MKAYVSSDEMYPVFFLTVEEDAHGLPVDFTASEWEQVQRSITEFDAAQQMIRAKFAAAGGYNDRGRMLF